MSDGEDPRRRGAAAVAEREGAPSTARCSAGRAAAGSSGSPASRSSAPACWNLYRGLARKFEDKWRTGEIRRTKRKWGGRAGVVGHVARFVVFGLIGVFVIKAAIDYNPKDAIGLDGALQKLAHAIYGPWLLGFTAAGLVCYGIYCLVDARYRDVSANT